MRHNSLQDAVIYFKQSMGAEDILNLRFDGLLLQATVAPTLETTVGEDVCGQFNIERAHFFDRETESRIG